MIAKIIHQVDAADWAPLRAEVFFDDARGEWLRIYRAPAEAYHATAIHFWVHALRDELAATGRREDLVGAAGHALCRSRDVEAWLAELDENAAFRATSSGDEIRAAVASAGPVQLHRMLESECRRSNVLDLGSEFVADFWSHGAGASWRRRAGWPL